MQIRKCGAYVLAFLVLYVLNPNNVAGQQGETSTSQMAMPTFIPPSPNAASLGKFGDVPVGLYTGVPNINIPLYSLSLGSFSLPISLNYHSSGLKVEELSSWIGLGWSLNAGGVITRTMHNKPDEKGNPGYWHQCTRTDLDLAENYPYQNSPFWLGVYDTEPDMFYFNFAGRSGKFILDTTAAHNGHCIPFQNLRISTSGGMGTFTITDENGIIYVFDVPEVTTLETTFYTSAWYLSRIITPAGTITFTYNSTLDHSSNVQTSYLDFIKPLGSTYSQKAGGSTITSIDVNSPVLTTITAPGQTIELYAAQVRSDLPGTSQLDSLAVKDRDGKIKKKFTFSHSYFGNANSSRYQDKRLKLDTVTEKSVSDMASKVYALSYYSAGQVPAIDSKSQDYWGFFNGNINTTLLPAMSKRDYSSIAADVPGADRSPDAAKALVGTLQSITYPTGGNSTFVYESNSYGYIQMKAIADTQYVDTTITAVAVKSSLANIPSQTFTFTIPKYQQAVVNFTTSYTGPVPQGDGPMATLNQINPDGSRTHLIQHGLNYVGTDYIDLTAGNYEIVAFVDGNNQYAKIWVTYSVKVYNTPADLITTYKGGGLCIKKIVNTDGITGQVNTRNYVYTVAKDSTRSSGNLITPVKFIELYYGYWARSSSSAIYLGTTQGSPIGYQMVQEFESNDTTAPIGRKESYFNTYPQNLLGNSFALHTNNGADTYYSPGGMGGSKMMFDYDVYRGYLLKEDFYNSQSVLIRESIHNYNLDSAIVPGSRNYFSLEARRGAFFNLCTGGCSCSSITDFCPPVTEQKLDLIKNTIFSPWIFKTSDVNTTYDQNGQNPVTQTINYFYDNAAITQPIRVTTINSKGDSLKTINYYVVDKVNITGLDAQASTAIDTMLARNIIAPVIQTEQYNNNVLSSRQRTDFKVWGSPRKNVAASKVWYQNGAGPLENRVNFLSYDTSNNVVQMAKLSDANLSYIWDYTKLYPIAEVKNADSLSIAYTSFEADGAGNWTIGSSSRNTGGALTGTRWYILSSNLSRSGLSSAKTYIVSYWTKNSVSFSITGTLAGYPIKGRTVQGWTFYMHVVTGQSIISINGTGGIDEVRLYPATAQMTTYAYDPLVGVTSQCDAASHITYYEYDGLQRLLRIRDMDGNIVKQFEYQYQFSAQCGANCYILPMTTFAGTNTISYPVGVFNANGKLLGNAANQAAYLTLWNADTANNHRGTLAAGVDSLHFQFTLTPGKSIPGITGCRYFQMDLTWNKIDAIRNLNGTYIDFGDSTGMRLAPNLSDSLTVLAPYTTQAQTQPHPEYNAYAYFFVHTYLTSNLHTLTFYHNDASEYASLDNLVSPATTLPHLSNLRGNLPQHTLKLTGNCYQQASMMTVAGITNWNSIHSIKTWGHGSGDGGVTPSLHLNYQQDFMAGNMDLENISTGAAPIGYFDSTFRISRLKSNWNAYFSHLKTISICDAHWSREDLSALTELNSFTITPGRQLYSNDPTGNPEIPIPQGVVDNIFIQIAAGAGQTIANGAIVIYSSGSGHSIASNAAITALLAKGWILYLDGVQLH